ncbi:MAG: DUF58 domain-containing protein [Chloroflexota bacterium]
MAGSLTPPNGATPEGAGSAPFEGASSARPIVGQRQAFLPTDVDPTVFDEAFLRQLERLLVIMRSPVRGGLKGGRRSVKRGQSVEFADYRDYTMGDDLRQLDWNVYARLERLFVKLFIEEEDVTVTLLVDASASMATGRPAKLLFAKRAAAALGYIGLASEDRVTVSALAGRVARRRAAMRGSGRVFRLLADLSAIEPADGPTDLVAAARHAAAQLHGKGVVILFSDLLDPGADRIIRELAATGSELIVLHVLSPDELDPVLEGDLRLVDVETGDGVDVTVDLATLDAYKARLAAWKQAFADLAARRRASYVDLSSDTNLAVLMFNELRRRRVLG